MGESITASQALAAGFSRKQLRSKCWTRVGYGLYRPTLLGADLADREQRLHDLDPALDRGEGFAHLTAAELYGLWLPAIPDWLSVQVSLPPESNRPMRPEIYAFRSRAGEQGQRVVRGLRVISPQVCIGQLAEDLSVLDLTIAIDSVLSQRLCTLTDIQAAIRRRQRGLPRLRQAMLLCDGRSESPWETILRLLHVSAGIEVEPQADISDEFDRFVARADLRVRGTRRIAEYDGAVHRDRSQHEADLRRDKALLRAGYTRFGYIASELLHHPELVIRDAERALGWRTDPTRVSAWHELAQPSTLTREGTRRLLHRLHRFG